MDQPAFRNDSRTLEAVIHNFVVIDEATRRIPAELKQRYPEVPWTNMEGMRHVLVHNYDRTEVDIVWKTIREDLPALARQLRSILEQSQ